jgi:hypothetical protein
MRHESANPEYIPAEVTEMAPVNDKALEQITRAEIDIQISTAHRFPRSLERFKKQATAMVITDRETAESCIYRRPVGKENGRPVFAEGLSVRMAEIVSACYGNIRVGAMITDMGDRVIKARGYAHDLENNVASTSEVVEACVMKDGRPYSERMKAVIAKAALAKARRDAIFQVVPKAMCKTLEAAAKQVISGDTEPLAVRVGRVEKWIATLGIRPHRVWAALDINGPSEMTEEHLITLTGLRTSINDKEVSIEEAFPDVIQEKKSKLVKPDLPDDEVPMMDAAPNTGMAHKLEPYGGMSKANLKHLSGVCREFGVDVNELEKADPEQLRQIAAAVGVD